MSTADVFSIAAVCSGAGGDWIARQLAGCAPVAVRDHPGAWLAWRPCTRDCILSADILVRMGERGWPESPTGCQDQLAGIVELDLRGLPPFAGRSGEPTQLTALSDFANGLNVGPWHWIDFEDLRQIFAAPGRGLTISAGLGDGEQPVEAAVEAAVRASTHGWRGAASAFITVAFAPGAAGLAQSKRACNVVHRSLAPDAFWVYVASESHTLTAGQVRVTVYANRASG